MYAKRATDYSTLPREQRALVLYAHAANQNCWSGGFSAMTRAERSHFPEAESIVAEVYSRSSGRVPDHLEAYECGECGQVYYGRENAEKCCSENEYEFLDDDDDDDNDTDGE